MLRLSNDLIKAIKSGGFLNQKTITLHLNDGTVEKILLHALEFREGSGVIH
jgi:hypothetical protein